MLIIDVLPSYFSINNVVNLSSEKWCHFLWANNRFDTIFGLNNLAESSCHPAFILNLFQLSNPFILLFSLTFIALSICLYIFWLTNLKLKKEIASVKKEQQILGAWLMDFIVFSRHFFCNRFVKDRIFKF